MIGTMIGIDLWARGWGPPCMAAIMAMAFFLSDEIALCEVGMTSFDFSHT